MALVSGVAALICDACALRSIVRAAIRAGRSAPSACCWPASGAALGTLCSARSTSTPSTGSSRSACSTARTAPGTDRARRRAACWEYARSSSAASPAARAAERGDLPPRSSARQVLEVIDTCRELSIKVSILPDVVEALGPSVEVDEVEGVTVLGVNPPVLAAPRGCSSAPSTSSSPAILLSSCAGADAADRARDQARLARPACSSPGAGRPRRPALPLLKFRTMVVDAEAAPRGADAARAATPTG